MIGAFVEDAQSLGLQDLGKRTGKLHGCPPKPWTNDREFRLAKRLSDKEVVSWCPSCGLIEGDEPKKTEVKVPPQFQGQIDKLRKGFDSSNPAIFFSTPGFIDFHCINGKITDITEEASMDDEELKGLVLHFLERGFFEPVFVVRKNGHLQALRSKVKKSSTPGSPQLHPQYVWAGKRRFPSLIEDSYSRDGQIKNALHHFDNEIAILDDLLSQLKEARAIFHLATNLDELAKLRSRFPNQHNPTPWKILIINAK